MRARRSILSHTTSLPPRTRTWYYSPPRLKSLAARSSARTAVRYSFAVVYIHPPIVPSIYLPDVSVYQLVETEKPPTATGRASRVCCLTFFFSVQKAIERKGNQLLIRSSLQYQDSYALFISPASGLITRILEPIFY
jgi:hypothetical protein